MKLPVLNLLSILLCYITVVRANTEIANLNARISPDVMIEEASKWPSLSSENSEMLLKVQPAPLGFTLESICDSSETRPCPYEIWTVLDLDSVGWEKYSKFTLRISWPASSPADFCIQTYTPTETWEKLTEKNILDHPAQVAQHSNVTISTSRRQYSRIRLVHTGVRPPSVMHHEAEFVPFIVRLEPLHLGFLPETAVPILFFLLPVIFIATIVLTPYANKRLADLALKAKKELDSASQFTRKDK